MLASMENLNEKIDQIIQNFLGIEGEIARGEFEWLIELEDVHVNIEVLLTKENWYCW